MRGPVISGWSAVSPYGIGRHAFVEGARSGHSTAVDLDPGTWTGPDEQACLVPDFNIRDVLGRKGTRSMDRVTGLAVTAVGRLLKDSPGPETDGTRVALVLGTNTGSAQSMMDLARDTFTQDKPYHVDPSHFPNTVMNCASGQCAIWYGLRGPNATVAAGRSSGLEALNYARRMLVSERADTVLCGAVEEYSAARSWLEHHTRDEDEAGTTLGEGCAVLRLEPAASVPEDTGLAEVLLVEAGVVGAEGVAASLEQCVRRALRRADVDLAQVWAVSPSSPAGRVGAEERQALTAVFGEAETAWVPQSALIGDTSAATAAFQIVSVLTAAENAPDARGRVAVITSVDRDGAIGCALLRLR
ncbi:beta-ketoacyl synthase N-terminal-like domain-containing protein [Streptomyces sp. NPDC020880]|uniref:beta-ketoacyl synthase N-terminal-like domain-containing protein n=1 Tax=Streptomyces sp. NPDC020880 TaxID=3365098 RepID=UPI00384F876F